MRGMLQTGIAARLRAQMAEWNLVRSQREHADTALEGARQLDADDVGRRADVRQLEHETQVDRPGPGDAS